MTTVSAVPFKSAGLQVATTRIPWPTDRLERVSINSFGIGGTNVHVSLKAEEATAAEHLVLTIL